MYLNFNLLKITLIRISIHKIRHLPIRNNFTKSRFQ